MTPADDFAPMDEKLRKQAADWLALMHGPDADAARPAFDAWRAADRSHQSAFEQVTARYDQSAFIGGRPVGRDRHLRRASLLERRPGAGAAFVAAFVLLAGIGVTTYIQTRSPAVDNLALAGPTAFASTDNGLRRIALRDGSEIILDRNSAVAVSYTPRRRSVELRRGRARFEAAPDAARPFVVNAGGAMIISRGTLFDVSLSTQGGKVSLIHGLVEVRLVGMGAAGSRLLHSGQQLAFVPAQPLPAPTAHERSAAQDDWTTMISFDGTHLSDAVTQINRGAPRPILLGPGLADLRVTGAFQAGDSKAFAAAIAAMFDLHLATHRNTISLYRLPDLPKKVGG